MFDAARKSIQSAFGRKLRRLSRDQDGAVLIYVTLTLTVLVGLAGLVIDGSRLYTLQTQLQAGADALALAGAAELDRRVDAIDRADAAIANLVQNSQTYAQGGAGVGTPTIRYLNGLPADTAAVDASFTTIDPAEARFVEVTMPVRTNNSFFIQAVGGGATASTNARAVAGFDQGVCQFTPLFLCNPFEDGAPGDDPSYSNIFQAVQDPAYRRRGTSLFFGAGGAGSQWVPGNFGLLDHPSLNGANGVRQAMGSVSPNVCFLASGVDTQTGAANGPVRQGLNTRFAIYEGSMAPGEEFRPARNVTKGVGNNNAGGTGQDCPNNYSPVWDPDAAPMPAVSATAPLAMQLPRDSCMISPGSACPYMNARQGTGDWNFEAYWTVNHGYAGVAAPTVDGAQWSNTNRPSRYQVYRWEIDNDATNTIPDRAGFGPDRGEDGHGEACTGESSDPTDYVSDDPDRRFIYAAIVNCNQYLNGGHNTDVPVEGFIKIFVTEPSDNGADLVIYGEIVDALQPGNTNDDDILRDIVQLYR